MSKQNIDELQQAFYENEWGRLQLGNQPGTTGWRTLVPAPDFVEFVSDLKSGHVTGKVLDLGCGGGRHSLLLASEGFEVFGIDFARAAIDTAIANAKTARLTIDFRVGDALKLPYEDSFFDVVNDDGCLHHIDPEQWPVYVQNVARVLRPGGILRVKAFSLNCTYFKKNAAGKPVSQWIRLANSGFTYFFSESDIRTLFRGPFEIEKLEEKQHTETPDKRFFFVVLKKLTTN
jgi:SAM-dependent methyltransferase